MVFQETLSNWCPFPRNVAGFAAAFAALDGCAVGMADLEKMAALETVNHQGHKQY